MTGDTPVYPSNQFKWKNGRGFANLSELHPIDHINTGVRGIYILSSKTGATVFCSEVHDEDGYDGEMMVYRAEVDHRDDVFVTIMNY